MQNDSSGWAVSDEEIARLTELFCEFEGSADPRSVRCKEAEVEFNSTLEGCTIRRSKPDSNQLRFPNSAVSLAVSVA